MPRPELVNPSTTQVTSHSATLGGEVRATGDSAVSERGIILWETATNPTPEIQGPGVAKLTTPGTAGVFTLNATNLAQGVRYSYRAFATNAAGPGYSDIASFTTLAAGAPPAVAPAVGAAAGVVGKPASWLSLSMTKLTEWKALETLAALLTIAVIVIVAYFVLRDPARENPENFARGLITVIFSSGTIAIAFILTFTAILAEDSRFKERFDKGKEVLTIMIGIFGTILGFYFGSAQTPTTPADAPKYALTGPAEVVAITKGTTGIAKLNLKQSGKLVGVVKLSVEKLPNGITTRFTKDTHGPNDGGDLDLNINVTAAAETGSHVLRILATRDAAVVGSVDVKIKVN